MNNQQIQKYGHTYQNSMRSLLKQHTKKYKEHHDSHKRVNDKLATSIIHYKRLQNLLNLTNIQKKKLSEKIKKLKSSLQNSSKNLQYLNTRNKFLNQQILKRTELMKEKQKEQYLQKTIIQQQEILFRNQSKQIVDSCQPLQKNIKILEDQIKKQKQILQQKIKCMDVERKRQKDQLLQLIKIMEEKVNVQQVEISQLSNKKKEKQKQFQAKISNHLQIYAKLDKQIEKMDNELFQNN